MKSEHDLIEWISNRVGPVAKPGIHLGIGDDCAILAPSAQPLLVSQDTLCEDVHFRRRWMSPYLLGRRALRVNLSDLAAMGANPLACLLSLSLPRHTPDQEVKTLLEGFLEETRRWNCPLIGGNLSSAGALHLAVTVFGRPAGEHPILRSTAQPGDSIYVVGQLGLARKAFDYLETHEPQGLDQVKSDSDLADWAGDPTLFGWMGALFLPLPQLEASAKLARTGAVHSMIDVSDGLASDLFQVSRASGLRAVLNEVGLDQVSQESGTLSEVLHGGDDYALLFTGRSEAVQEVVRELPKAFEIGYLEEGPPELLLETRAGRTSIRHEGFDHFR